jgi:hypothetical protein
MNRLLSLVLVLAIAGNTYLAWELNSRTPPSSADLENDLAVVRAQRAALKAPESSALATAVDPIYAQTQAMLEQRYQAALRFVTLSYSVQGQEVAVASPQELAMLDEEIRQQQSRVDAAKLDVVQYSGGLIQGLVQMRLTTAELTLAGLQQRKLALKYRFALPSAIAEQARPDAAALAAIEFDLSEKRKAVASSEREASRYTGGLVLAMLLSRIETDKLTIAMLEQRQLSLKHNIGLPTLNIDSGKPLELRKPPGKVVDDKEAIQ